MITRLFDLIKRNSTAVFITASCLLLIWLARAPIGGFLRWIADREAVVDFIQGYGSWGIAMYAFLLIVQLIIAFVPGQALVFAGGYIFGFWETLLVTVPVAVVGSQIAFYLARHLGRPLAYRLATQKAIDRWEAISKNQGIVFYFLAFNLPIFPSDAMCYVAGLATISGGRFFVANLLGRLVSTIFTVTAGAYGFSLPPVFWVVFLLVVAGLYFGWVVYAQKENIDMDKVN